MKLSFFVFLGLLFSYSSKAQTQFSDNNINNPFTDKSGRLVSGSINVLIDGSPYFKPDYCLSNITLSGGRTYNGIKTKLNLQNNDLIYTTSDGGELAAAVPITKIVYTGCDNEIVTFEAGFPAIEKQDQNSYYQVLDTGKAKLLKHYTIFISEGKSSNGMTATDTKSSYQRSESYYVYNTFKTVIKIIKSDSDLLDVLSDKKAEIQAYISSTHFKVKKQAELIKLLDYYNSLK